MHRSSKQRLSLLLFSDHLCSKYITRSLQSETLNSFPLKLNNQISRFQSSNFPNSQPDSSLVMKLYSKVHPKLLRFVNSFDDVLGIREIREAQSRVLDVWYS